MKALKFLFAIGVLFYGCRHEVDPTPVDETDLETPEVWTERSWFIETISKIKVTSRVAGNKLYLYGPDFLNSIDDKGAIEGWHLFLPYPSFHQLPLTDSWLLQTDQSLLIFSATKSPLSYSDAVDLKGLEPEFMRVHFPNTYYQKGMDANDANECLVALWTGDSGNMKSAFYRFRVKINQGTIAHVVDTTKIDLPQMTINGVFGTKDYFLVSLENNEGNGTYKIYPDGTFKKVNDKFTLSFFRIDGGRLLATGSNSPVTIHVSGDEGETWSSYNPSHSLLVSSSYSMVGDSVVGFNRDKLFTFKLKSGGYTIRSLNNEGLNGSEITSVAALKDSVFITTYGGTFVKSKSGFFITKSKEGTK